MADADTTAANDAAAEEKTASEPGTAEAKPGASTDLALLSPQATIPQPGAQGSLAQASLQSGTKAEANLGVDGPAGPGAAGTVDAGKGAAIGAIAGPASGSAQAGFEAALAATEADESDSTADIAPPSSASGMSSGGMVSGGPSAAETKAHPASAQAPAAPPVPVGAVPMTIGLRALAGSNRFDIRLDPIELGRIDVALDIDKDRGTVEARVVVDRPETLALLQRDASNLQQALSQAGLDPGQGVALSLRGEGSSTRDEGTRRDGPNVQGASGHGTDASPVAAEAVPLRQLLRGLGGVDIRI